MGCPSEYPGPSLGLLMPGEFDIAGPWYQKFISKQYLLANNNVPGESHGTYQTTDCQLVATLC